MRTQTRALRNDEVHGLDSATQSVAAHGSRVDLQRVASLSQYLAYDLGASSGRAILGRLERGRMHVELLHRFETPLIEVDGHLYWDVDALWVDLEVGFERARARTDRVQSLSVDSWGVDYIPLDSAGHLVRRPYAYRDARTAGLMEEAARRVTRERVYAETGIQFMEINTLYQAMADVRDERPLIARTSTRLLIADYFNYRFSGIPLAEVSLASTTQLMRPGQRAWANSLMADLGVPVSGWPDIVPSATVLGPAKTTTDTMVVAGCSHDTACAVAATPAEHNSWAYISCGTWSLLGVELLEPVLTDKAREAGFTNEAGLDGTIRFLKNLTGLWILQECEREWREAGEAFDLETMLDEAAAHPGSPMVLDVNDPRLSRRGGMVETIGICCEERGIATPSSRAGLVRLILDSLADGHRRTLGELETVLGRRIDVLHMVGGGSRNTLLCQLTANRCGRAVVAGPAEATSLGNLLIQARAMGDLQGASIREIVRASTRLRRFDPAVR